MLTDNDKFAELYNVEVWFREKTYKVNSITIQPTPDWLKENDIIPQSLIELKMKDYGLQSHVEQYLQSTHMQNLTAYVDITAHLTSEILKIKNALLVGITDRHITALGNQITQIKGNSFEIWTPPNAKLLHLINHDPTLARFLELLEE